MNDKAKGGVALFLLIGCGIWLTSYFTMKPKPGQTVTHTQPLVCAACGQAYVEEAGELPAVCTKCGKKEAYRALKCLECKALFPLVRASESFGGQTPIQCTKCGKSKFTSEISPNDIHAP